VLGLVAGLVPTASAAQTGTCPAFVVFRGSDPSLGSYHYRASHVRRSLRITCQTARNLLKGAYGGGPLRPIKKVYPRDDQGHQFGRPTYWFRGGWRCSNGAGGAACWNAVKDRYNAVPAEGVDHGFVVTADVGS
jgi:hypothetical protein